MSELTNLDFLSKIDFLKNLPDDVLESVANECLFKSLEDGEVLFEDGEEGNSMFVILSGGLTVIKHDTDIAVRGMGEYIGEMALIESKPRSAKVVSSGVTHLLEITHDLFHSKLSSYPDTLMAIMKTLSRRARENLKMFDKAETENDILVSGGDDKLEKQMSFLMQEAGLTQREADVARLICEGLSDKEIAKKINLSPHTVKDHLKKVYSKFRVHARTQLVSLMYK
ncbi:MAG: Crp/Fnr family transcriptional regulator [Nitrospinae bacterium]|nr:Crp/Fnr family transcriptional regulator [Nitrospinota bacterium]